MILGWEDYVEEFGIYRYKELYNMLYRNISNFISLLFLKNSS